MLNTQMYGYSYPFGKAEIADFLLPTLKPNASILDIGAGSGIYREILGYNFNWSAVELWPATAEYLQNKYNKVYNIDMRDFIYPQNYDLIIFGDVLEHFTVKDAQNLLEIAEKHSHAILIAVPFELEQEVMYGNIGEKHLQPDLTPEIFAIRYPKFQLIHCVTQNHKPLYGYYYFSKEE